MAICSDMSEGIKAELVWLLMPNRLSISIMDRLESFRTISNWDNSVESSIIEPKELFSMGPALLDTLFSEPELRSFWRSWACWRIWANNGSDGSGPSCGAVSTSMLMLETPAPEPERRRLNSCWQRSNCSLLKFASPCRKTVWASDAFGSDGTPPNIPGMLADCWWRCPAVAGVVFPGNGTFGFVRGLSLGLCTFPVSIASSWLSTLSKTWTILWTLRSGATLVCGIPHGLTVMFVLITVSWGGFRARSLASMTLRFDKLGDGPEEVVGSVSISSVLSTSVGNLRLFRMGLSSASWESVFPFSHRFVNRVRKALPCMSVWLSAWPSISCEKKFFNKFEPPVTAPLGLRITLPFFGCVSGPAVGCVVDVGCWGPDWCRWREVSSDVVTVPKLSVSRLLLSCEKKKTKLRLHK